MNDQLSMIAMNDGGIGHNQPPLLGRIRALVDNANRWLSERPIITDAEMAGAAQTFVDQLRRAIEDIDKASRAERKPFEDEIADIKKRWFEPAELVRLALIGMGPLLTEWLQSEKLRLIREKHDRQAAADAAIDRAVRLRTEVEGHAVSVDARFAADEAMREADAAIDRVTDVPASPQVKGDYAKRAMYLRNTWTARIVDEDAALRYYATHAFVRTAVLLAIQKEATRHAKQAKDPTQAPPGIRFIKEETAT